MTTIEEIKAAIRKLTAQDLASLRAWFAEFDAAQWDWQIENAVAAGRLDALAEEALEDLRQARTTEL